MKFELGKKDANIISWELLCTLNSIKYYKSKKPEVTLRNFKEYKQSIQPK